MLQTPVNTATNTVSVTAGQTPSSSQSTESVSQQANTHILPSDKKGFYQHQPQGLLKPKPLADTKEHPVIDNPRQYFSDTAKQWIFEKDRRQMRKAADIVNTHRNLVKNIDHISTNQYLNLREEALSNTELSKEVRYHIGLLLVPLQKKVIAGELEGNKYFSNFNIDKGIYHLFIDKKHAHIGETAYDDERGYLNGILDGLIAVLSTRGEELTTKMFEDFRDICISNVHQKPISHEAAARNPFGKEFNLGFRDCESKKNVDILEHTIHIGIKNNYNYNAEGIKEFLENNQDKVKFYKQDRDNLFLLDFEADVTNNNTGWGLVPFGDNQYRLCCGPKTRAETIEYIDERLDAYNKNIRDIINMGKDHEKDDNIIKEIALLCRDLEQYHPFEDANLRTIAFLTMFKLLMDNDLSPTILEEPNRFDGYDINTLVNDIKDGQQYFESFRASM